MIGLRSHNQLGPKETKMEHRLFKASTLLNSSPSPGLFPQASHSEFEILETKTNASLRIPQAMSYRREHRAARASLFDGMDGLEEGGLRVSSSYSHETNDHDNERAVDSLQDRVIFLKRLTGDIHDEVESHNRLLDRMGNDMDSSRGVMSGTMERFKMVFEKKSSRRMCTLVACIVLFFLIIFYLIRVLRFFWLG